MRKFLQLFRFLFWLFRTEDFPDLLEHSDLPGADFTFPDDEEGESIPVLTEGVWQYRILHENSAEICGWTGRENVLVIPESLAGYRVGTIGANAFRNRADLEELQLPGNIYSIGEGAFSGCSSLRKVVLAPGVTMICEGAFERCTALEEICIPNTVTRIESNTFSGCSSLRCVSLNEGLYNLGEAAFSDCSALKSVCLPASLEDMDSWIFLNSGIKEVFVYRYSEGEKYCRSHWIPYRLVEEPKKLHNRFKGRINRKNRM